MTQERTRRSAPAVALGIAAFLVAYNNIVNFIPQPLHNQVFVPMNLAVLAALLAWTRYRGFSWSGLGFSTARWGTSLRWGLGLGLAVPSPMFLGLALPAGLFDLADPREFGEASAAMLAYHALLRIPLGTALFEEASFRGVLYGVSASAGGVRSAVIVSSTAFALWHVTPTYELMSSTNFFPHPALLWLTVAGGVAATFVGGLFFAWIRFHTGAMYGSAIAHWLINGMGLLASFLYGQ